MLPVLNKKAVEFALKMALATNCRVAPESVFARKNYFYPDLPKGYQISQYELPLAEHGYLDITVDGAPRRIGITRIHLQEDPVDQYGVEKIAGLGGPNCPLRWAINGYKPEQAGEYHKEVLEATANSSVLAERGWVAFRVLKVVPEAIPPLDDVREKVLGELLDDRARDRVRADLEALRKAAEDGRKPLEDVGNFVESRMAEPLTNVRASTTELS